MVKYIQKGSTVHSVNDGDAVPAGFTVIDAATAKAANPQLFGKADPAVLQTWRPYARDSVGNVYVPTGDPTTAPNYPQWSGWAG
jgi:hypothetical protein